MASAPLKQHSQHELKALLDEKIASVETHIKSKLEESRQALRGKIADIRRKCFPAAAVPVAIEGPSAASSARPQSAVVSSSADAQAQTSLSEASNKLNIDANGRQTKRQRTSDDIAALSTEPVHAERSVAQASGAAPVAVAKPATGKGVAAAPPTSDDDFSFKENGAHALQEASASLAPAMPLVSIAAAPPAPPKAAAGKKGKGKGKMSIAVPAALSSSSSVMAVEPEPEATASAAAAATSVAPVAMSPAELGAAYARFVDSLKGKPEVALGAWSRDLVQYVQASLPADAPHPVALAMQRFQPAVVALLLADGLDPSPSGMGKHKLSAISGDGLAFGTKDDMRLDGPALLQALKDANAANGTRSKSMTALRKISVMLAAVTGKEASTEFIKSTAAEILKSNKPLPAGLQGYAPGAAARAPAPAVTASASYATPPRGASRHATPAPVLAKTPAVVRTSRKVPGPAKAATLAAVAASEAGAEASAAPAMEVDSDADDGSLPDLDFDVNVEAEADADGAGAGAEPTQVGASSVVDEAVSVPMQVEMCDSARDSAGSPASAAYSAVTLVTSEKKLAGPETSQTEQAAPTPASVASASASTQSPAATDDDAMDGALPQAIAVPAIVPTTHVVSAYSHITPLVPATPATDRAGESMAGIAPVHAGATNPASIALPATTPASLPGTASKHVGVAATAAAGSHQISSLAAAERNRRAAEEAEAERVRMRAAYRAQIDQRKAALAAGTPVAAAAQVSIIPVPAAPVASSAAAAPASAMAAPAPAAAAPGSSRLVAEMEARMRAAEDEKRATSAAAAASRVAEAQATTQGVREKAVAAVAGSLGHAAVQAPAPTKATAAIMPTAMPMSAGVGPNRPPHSASKAPMPTIGVALPGIVSSNLKAAPVIAAALGFPSAGVIVAQAAGTAVVSLSTVASGPTLGSATPGKPPVAPTSMPLSAAGTMSAAAARILSPTRSANQLVHAGSPAAKAVALQQASALASYAQSAAQSQAGAGASRAADGVDDNYCLSDKGSDSEDEEEDKPRKPIPDWARGQALDAALAAQYGGAAPVDPDAVFTDPPETCNLEAIFPIKKKRFNKRTSSGLWHQDRLTAGEKDKYRVDMGFAAITAAAATASASVAGNSGASIRAASGR